MKAIRILTVALCFICAPLMTFAQVRITVKGCVLDEQSLPVIGASVMVKGTSQGVPTDLDGNYAIEVPAEAVLEYSCIGYATVQAEVAGRKIGRAHV